MAFKQHSLENRRRLPYICVSLIVFSAIFAVFLSHDHQRYSSHPFRKSIRTDYYPLEDFHNNTLVRRVDANSCTKDTPCQTNACCGSFFGGDTGTCGFGETYCGSDCASKCDAKAECGQYADPPGKACPLNVCCSEFGFCGMTDEFCLASEGCQSNCGYPNPPPGASTKGVLQKVIGYYEAWMERSDCHGFPPAAIPVDGLTHVNFAFASIEPDTFEIIPMDSATPAQLFTQTADVRTLKSGNSDLEVFISLGGWTFSDNDTETQPVFGNIARNKKNRQKFADNLVLFMQNYGFDGVDLDWEYPGAPDRGGHPEDVENFVKLMRTLRETFDNSGRGSYGLTFTIPSSYWYLRWFDLPGLLEYSDWVNIMSYDLHGIWDSENRIGNQVLAHTNLTEIKQATDLLWRNNVSPGKVVLGVGFYGRSFKLKDKSCTAPGCPFSGNPTPGSCSDNAGTLAYFEIQDLIKSKKPKVIHEKKDAVNYFVYDEEQWISYDDDVTFKQKVDWANDTGLGGVMIWSVDQDDSNYSALTGLLGRSPGDFGDIHDGSSVSDAGHWASMDGQKCIRTDCGLLPQCPSGYEMAPFPGPRAFPDDCGGDEGRIICCPVNAMPQSCVWRGGESGRSCHGQCHEGESTLFHSRHATVDCLSPGFQAACCDASTFGEMIDACFVGPLGYKNLEGKKVCPDGFTKIAKQFKVGLPSFVPGSGTYRPLCCPDDSAFEGCHWVGQGTCDDNECDDNDVQVMLDRYGDSSSQCAAGLNHRKKALCCNAPKNLNPFLPVDLDKIFPTLPPEDYFPQFDLQHLGGYFQPAVDEPNQQAFGMVIIDGPPETVSNLQRRDGSHLEILSCDDISEDRRSTIRIACMSDASDADCDIGGGVTNGTILRMPDGCGPGQYAVAHDRRHSQDQRIPGHLKRSTAEEPDVHDLDISYDFSLIKRDAGDIYIRIDYSNAFDYWDEVVRGDPVTKRSGEKRFYSPNSDAWESIYDSIRDDGRDGFGKLRNADFDQLLIAEKGPDSCSDDTFMRVNVGGSITEKMKFGFTFVGTISPEFKIEEANGFFDTKISYQGSIDVNTRGNLDLKGLSSKALFRNDISKYGFSHPGICSFKPELNIQARVIGSDYNLDADFTANFAAGNDPSHYTLFNQPLSLGDASGGVTNEVMDEAFTGGLSISASSSSGKRKQPGEGTVLGIELLSEATMNIDLNAYHSPLTNANAELRQYVDSWLRIKDDETVTFTNARAGYEMTQVGDLPGWDEVDDQRVGDTGKVNILHKRGGSGLDTARDIPDLTGHPVFSGDVVTCSEGRSLRCPSPEELAKEDPSLLLDPETGEPYSDQYGNIKRDLDVRAAGGRRRYNVRAPTGNSDFTIQSPAYFYGENGEALLRANSDAGHHGAEDQYDCDNIETTDDSSDPTVRWVTEHGLELGYMARVLSFMMTGQNRDPDGTTYTTERPLIPFNVFGPGGRLHQDYANWDPNGGRVGTPLSRMWEAFGSTDNPQQHVNAESVLNSYKARIWNGNQPMADETWEENGYNEWNTAHSAENARSALGVINQVFYVYSYLNNNINDLLSDGLELLRDELSHFGERVNAIDNLNLPDLGDFHMEYMHYVLVPRLERVEAWAVRRLGELRETWRHASAAQHLEATAILQTIEKKREELEELLIDTSDFPDIPSTSR